MNFILKISVLTALSSLVFPNVYAGNGYTPLTNSRCRYDDYVTPEQVRGRNDWALKCNHITKSDWNNAMYYIDENMNVVELAVGRQQYIVIGRQLAPNAQGKEEWEIWRAPVSPEAPCDLPVVSDGGNQFSNAGKCVGSGCYAPNQRIAFEKGYEAIGKAEESKLSNVLVLDGFSSIFSPKYLVAKVESYIKDNEARIQNIVTFETKSGKKLRVTENHPMLLEDGIMTAASEVTLNNSFLSETGKKEELFRISTQSELIRNANLQPNLSGLKNNLVLAEGLLTGSLRYQNEYNKYLNRVQIRKILSK